MTMADTAKAAHQNMAIMKNSSFLTAVLFAGAAVGLTGCSHKPDAKSELDKAAAILEKSDSTVVAPPQAASSPTPVPTAPVPGQPQPAATPARQMNAAIAAYKAGNLDDAVTRLQKLRATPVMAPEQRIAVNDAIAAVMNEIGALAAKGDARAIAAAKLYEQMQTRPR
jgi:hypothetical protein